MAEDPRFLLHFKTLAKFKEKLADGTVNPDRHLVFIKDEKLVWCRGIYYSDASKLDNFSNYYNDWSVSQANANTITITLKGKKWNETTREWEDISKPLVLNPASNTIAGLMSAQDKTKSDRITGVNYTLSNPTSTTNNRTIRITGLNPNTNTAVTSDLIIPSATQSTAGLLDTTDKKAIDNLKSIGSFSHVNDDDAFTRTATDVNLNFRCRSTDMNDSDSATVHSPGIGAATQALAGVMTAADKTKSDRITTTDFTLNTPTTTATSLTIPATKKNPSTNVTSNNNINIPLATTTAAGIINATEKKKLDYITVADATATNVEGIRKITLAAASTDTASILTETTADFTKVIVEINDNFGTNGGSGDIFQIRGQQGTTVATDNVRFQVGETIQARSKNNVLERVLTVTDLTDGSVTNIGTADVGSAVRPIYLNKGVPTAGTYTFGNASGNVPISNGTLNTNLNADLLDGQHGSYYATATSVSNHIADKSNPHSVTAAQVGLGNVTNESKATMFTSPVFTGTPTAPTPTVTTNSTQIATTAFVQSAITKKLSDVDAMIYKGVVKANSELPATHEAGWTYIVSVAGTYAGKVCEVGDMIICNTDGTAANDAHWDVIQTNINGAVTGPASATDGAIALFNGTTGKVVKNSATVGSATRPIYLNNGVPTAGTYTFGNASGNAAINNGTVNTNLNADMLDGLHSTSFPRADQSPTVDLDTVNGYGIMCNALDSNATTARHYPINQAGILIYGAAAYNSANQIYGSYNSNRWFARGGGHSPTNKTTWREFAFTDSNIASASKLQTARNIALTGHVTGNANFDGSANITITTTNPRKKANKITNLSAVPTDGDLCICTISANATLGLSGTLNVCEEVHVIIKNSGSSAITVTIPSTFINTMSDPLEIEAGAYAELNILSDGTSNYVRGIGS